MKNRKYILLTLIELMLLLGTTQAFAQSGIFILDEDEFYKSDRIPVGGGSGFVIPDMPNHDDTIDYTPIGGGAWVLTALGMCYLYGKRKNKKNQ